MHGNVIANKKEKVPLNDDNSKNNNNVEQLESLLKQQTDMLLPLMVSLSNKSDLALGELDRTGVAILNVNNEISNIKNEMVNVKTDLSEEIVNVKADLSTEIVNVKTELSSEIISVKGDTDLIKLDVTAFKNDLCKVKTDMANIENKVEFIEKKSNKDLAQVKGEIRIINQKMERNE